MDPRVQRVLGVHRGTFPLRSLAASLGHIAGRGPRPVSLLLISDEAEYTSEQQFAPLARHARLLRQRLGLVVVHRPLSQAAHVSERSLRRFDAVGLKMSFRTHPEQAAQTLGRLRTAVSGARAKLVYFDGDDDLNIQWGFVADQVDVYVKKHVFADPDNYKSSYRGKSNLTDYVSRQFGTSFDDNIIQQSGGLTPPQIKKIHLGWNIALDDKIVNLAGKLATAKFGHKDIDISCRAFVPSSVWTHPLRELVIREAEKLGRDYSVLVPRDRVPPEKYYEEMLRSRICISPFGFGEICWRDFEAILCGCLLLKPDMSHLKTAPNLFVPGETYVPVRWDFSDLEEQCTHYLGNEAQRQRIAAQARQRLLASLQPGWFLRAVSDLLGAAGVQGPQHAS